MAKVTSVLKLAVPTLQRRPPAGEDANPQPPRGQMPLRLPEFFFGGAPKPKVTVTSKASVTAKPTAKARRLATSTHSYSRSPDKKEGFDVLLLWQADGLDALPVREALVVRHRPQAITQLLTRVPEALFPVRESRRRRKIRNGKRCRRKQKERKEERKKEERTFLVKIYCCS